jgi:hypothetical protein
MGAGFLSFEREDTDPLIILFRGNLEEMKILVAQADEQGVSGGRDTDIAVMAFWNASPVLPG